MSTLVARQQSVELLPYKWPELAKSDAYQPAASLTVARGTVMGQITAAGATQYQIKPYAAGNADGSQVPIGVSIVDFSTDAAGNITLGIGTAFGLPLGHMQTVPVYINGSFRVSDLTGLDAGATTVLFARTLSTADGTNYVRIP